MHTISVVHWVHSQWRLFHTKYFQTNNLQTTSTNKSHAACCRCDATDRRTQDVREWGKVSYRIQKGLSLTSKLDYIMILERINVQRFDWLNQLVCWVHHCPPPTEKGLEENVKSFQRLTIQKFRLNIINPYRMENIITCWVRLSFLPLEYIFSAFTKHMTPIIKKRWRILLRCRQQQWAQQLCWVA